MQVERHVAAEKGGVRAEMKLIYSSSQEDGAAYSKWSAERRYKLLDCRKASTELLAQSEPTYKRVLRRFRASELRLSLLLKEFFKEPCRYGRHTLEMIDGTLREDTIAPGSEVVCSRAVFKYNQIAQIVQLPEHVFIVTTTSGAFVIPRQKMAEGDLEQFLNELQLQLPSPRIRGSVA